MGLITLFLSCIAIGSLAYALHRPALRDLHASGDHPAMAALLCVMLTLCLLAGGSLVDVLAGPLQPFGDAAEAARVAKALHLFNQ